MDPSPGMTVGQRFQLEAPLARGGMGSVWLARHVTLGSRVAVKFMLAADADDAARARFEREARTASRIPSPHIVKILDYGVDDTTPYIAMELLSGEDLRQRLDREGRLALPALARIMRQVSKGLALAHAAGIVHRDLKPSNIFLARSGDEEIAKILDFGVAKATRASLSGEHTATGILVGSPEYMSPEQARALPLDHRSDIWSLGVVAFFALTGERPFAGNSFGDTMVKICSDEIPSATAIVAHLPEALDAFFARALCRSPDGRFSSAADFAEELEAIANAAPHAADADGARRGVQGRTEETLEVGFAIQPSPMALRLRRWFWVAPVLLGALGIGGFVWTARAHREVAHPAGDSPAPPEPSVASTDASQPAASSLSIAPLPSTAPSPLSSPSTSRPRALTATPVHGGRVRPSPSPGPTTKIDPKYGLPVPSSP